jgi:hypothetical protein
MNPIEILLFSNSFLSVKGFFLHFSSVIPTSMRLFVGAPPELYGQSLPPLRSSSVQNQSATLCSHPDQKSMSSFPFDIGDCRKCFFHNS